MGHVFDRCVIHSRTGRLPAAPLILNICHKYGRLYQNDLVQQNEFSFGLCYKVNGFQLLQLLKRSKSTLRRECFCLEEDFKNIAKVHLHASLWEWYLGKLDVLFILSGSKYPKKFSLSHSFPLNLSAPLVSFAGADAVMVFRDVTLETYRSDRYSKATQISQNGTWAIQEKN